MKPYYENEHGKLYHGDCLEVMSDLDIVSDMILCDPPYGNIECKWDSIIPFEPMWKEIWNSIKNNGAVVLMASQPFTSALVMSQPKKFRYQWVWDKINKYTGALNSNKMSMRRHEDVTVFYQKLPTYNKQMRDGEPYVSHQTKGHGDFTQYGNTKGHTTVNKGGRNPCSILEIKADVKTELGLHPTQKPVALFEYLINTYTNEGELVLDFCSGSSTTAVASQNTNRRWICIEKEEKYCEISTKRIKELNK